MEGYTNFGIFGNVKFTIAESVLKQFFEKKKQNSVSYHELLYCIVLHNFSKIITFVFYQSDYIKVYTVWQL